jgi:hypothetical protein
MAISRVVAAQHQFCGFRMIDAMLVAKETTR